MAPKIQVAILDDHQAILDGYLFRLSGATDIQVVATMMYGEELEPVLARQTVDVLILDVSTPTSTANANPYPIHYLIPMLLDRYEDIAILVITMHNQRTLARTILEAGASGYILKDDRAAMIELASIVRLVHNGGIYLSQQISDLLTKHPDTSGPFLTPRQVEILSYCAACPDLSTAEIAQKLQIAHSTVRNLLSGVYMRLEVSNRAAAIARARSTGLIPEGM
jgi:DNA-binding NarL/FixJ family response regulator